MRLQNGNTWILLPDFDNSSSIFSSKTNLNGAVIAAPNQPMHSKTHPFNSNFLFSNKIIASIKALADVINASLIFNLTRFFFSLRGSNEKVSVPVLKEAYSH
ncbi:hypothetical protein VNO77_05995 [Canavalia gladiata]|uniref:Uncharacterized protein n=1 Tax=Canavalia gladiata TaxID=3824 RepID=A0AAN9N1D6_CANGL